MVPFGIIWNTKLGLEREFRGQNLAQHSKCWRDGYGEKVISSTSHTRKDGSSYLSTAFIEVIELQVVYYSLNMQAASERDRSRCTLCLT